MHLVELDREKYKGYELVFAYTTDRYYDVVRREGFFSVDLVLKSFDAPVKKQFTGKLFEPYLEDSVAYGLAHYDEMIGFLEVDYSQWSNRLRVTELIISEPFRGKGYGSLLIKKAIAIGQERGCREVILETQTCNYKAIQAYLKNGFVVNGLDLSCYSNEDVEGKEVRIEMVHRL